ncbi:MAG: ABC transporter permease [Alphaproteobacteria bacterium]
MTEFFITAQKPAKNIIKNLTTIFKKKFGKKFIGPLDYTKRGWMRWFLAFAIFFLYAPIVWIIIFSFNDATKYNIIWEGFTLANYPRVFVNEELLSALLNSLTIAFFNTIFSTILGVLAGLSMWRYKFRFKPISDGLLGLPLVIPEICMGVAFLVFFSRIGWPNDLPWPLSLSSITLAHITFSFPFVTLIIRSRLSGFNQELEWAARDLGASETMALRDIILPFLKPAIIAGALMSFTLSLDDFVITFFTGGPDSITLPVKIFSAARRGISPDYNAAFTMLIVLTVILVYIGLRMQTTTIKKEKIYDNY